MMNALESEAHFRRIWKGGLAILGCGLLLGGMVTLVVAAKYPFAALAIPATPIAFVGLWQLFKRPVLNLALLLCSFAFVARFKEGFQIEELVFAGYLVLFFGWWFARQSFADRRHLITGTEDFVLLFFLSWIVLTIPLTLLFGGSLKGAVSEWTALLMLAFHFPVKDAVARHENGPRVILIVIFWLAIFAAVRNLMFFRESILSTTHLWQLIHGRLALNEILLLVGSLASLTLLVHVDKLRLQVPLAGALVVLLGCLILTKSRAYWIDFAVGLSVLAFVGGASVRRRIGLWSTGSILCLGAVSVLLFGDLVLELFIGFADRLVSIPSAIESDISLINRFHEAGSVWKEILESPIIGHGIGVKYRTFDIIEKVTLAKAYTHNGIFSLWFKFGIVGLTLFCIYWVRVTWLGIQTYSRASLPRLERVYALIAFLGLLTYLPSVATSNPFFLSDTLIMFGILGGWSSGLSLRARDED